MAISYTSNYDELKNYREALLDRLAELIIANHTRITNRTSIVNSQKFTYEGKIQTGLPPDIDESGDDGRLVLFKKDTQANNTDLPLLEQILNIFSAHGNTDDPNNGIAVNMIDIEFHMNEDGNEVPHLSAPGIPPIPLPEVGEFFNDNVSQFVDIKTEKQKFFKESIKEFLQTEINEILPDNITMIRKINQWFQEFDSLKTYIEPGQIPHFKTSRELFESDAEKLTFFVRQASDLLYPQAHPIYSAENYYNTESTLIQLDNQYKSERKEVQDVIDLLSIRNESQDRMIKLVTDRIIPILTDKYTEQLKAEGQDTEGFSVHQLEALVEALRTNNFSMVMDNPIYSNNFENIEIDADNTNDWTLNNEEAKNLGLVSGDWTHYHGIAIACQPGAYKSNSKYGILNQYGSFKHTTLTINEYYTVTSHGHRHQWGGRHDWTTRAYFIGDGNFEASPTEFKVTHPSTAEYTAKLSGVWETAADIKGVISNVSPSGLQQTDIKEPPRGFSGTTQNAQITVNGTTYTYDYTWGAHSKGRSAVGLVVDDEPFVSRPTNLSVFWAYIGGDVDRFSDNKIKTAKLATIIWDGTYWYYEKPGKAWKTSYKFKPRFDDFIIGAMDYNHWSEKVHIDWMGSSWSEAGDAAIPTDERSYYHSQKHHSNYYQASSAAGGNWSGYYRRRFSAKSGLEHWRDHGDPRGTQGFIDTDQVEVTDPDGSGGTTSALQIMVNSRITNNNVGGSSNNRYDNQYQAARQYYHMVGMEDESALSILEEGQVYTILFHMRASRPGVKWRAKIGDYRHGHSKPIWSSQITKIAQDTDWHTYAITGITPISRGNEPSNSLFSQYDFPNQNTRAQMCFGIKPALYDTNGNQVTPRETAIEQMVGEWIQIDNVEIYLG